MRRATAATEVAGMAGCFFAARGALRGERDRGSQAAFGPDEGNLRMRRRRWTSGVLSAGMAMLVGWAAIAQTSDPFQSAPGPAPAAPPAPQRVKPQTAPAVSRPARPHPPPAPEQPTQAIVAA